MATSHLEPGVKINLGPLGDAMASTRTQSLFKTRTMEALRLVLPVGKKIPEHKTPGEITVHCLEGCIKFSLEGTSHELNAGDMLYLEAATPHAVEAITDSSVLVTIVLNNPN